jgi:uncharacterized protein YndB with AHSA1/START domain
LVDKVHVEKQIKAPISKVYGAFREERALRIWYDPRSRVSNFKVGGKLTGDNYPSAEISALVPNHTIVHRYSDIVAGIGIWSFVEKSGGKTTLLVLDHLDASEDKDELESIAFYWRGLIDNLAAFCEGRELPFDHDTGDYKPEKKPHPRKP